MIRCCSGDSLMDIGPVPFDVIIPARHDSTRLPGKPLLDLCGRPMIQWVWERACASGAGEVIIATDDVRVEIACRTFGAKVELTASTHASGTDRLAEIVNRRGFTDDHVIVNVQGDEPLVPPGVIAALAHTLQERADCDIATPVTHVESEAQWRDPNCVKVVGDISGHALYFSRAPIPWPRDGQAEPGFAGGWRHIGLYAWRSGSLRRFTAWEPSSLESIEKLEQLRALEHGMRIHLLPLTAGFPAGVDTIQDLARVRAVLEAGGAGG